MAALAEKCRGKRWLLNAISGVVSCVRVLRMGSTRMNDVRSA